jgi:hypothetical protein
MSIKIKNNLDLIIYFGFENEEKLPIMDKEYQDITKETKEYSLRISEIYEDFQDKIYKITPPCVVSVDEGFVVSLLKDGKTKVLKQEKPKKINEDKKEEEKVEDIDLENLPELITKKELNIMVERLKENNSYLFINDDYGKYYKFVEQKMDTLEFSLENPLLKEDNKILINPFKTKFSPFVNFTCKIIYHNDRIIKKKFLIDINSSYEKIIKKIAREIKPFVHNMNYRIIYKGEDISLEEINQKLFKKIPKNKIKEKETRRNYDDKNENNNNMDIEDFTNDAFLLRGVKKEEKDTQNVDRPKKFQKKPQKLHLLMIRKKRKQL